MRYAFGENLKKYRKEKKITQSMLADRLHMSHAIISNWERGVKYPMLDKVYDIANILGIEVVELFR